MDNALQAFETAYRRLADHQRVLQVRIGAFEIGDTSDAEEMARALERFFDTLLDGWLAHLDLVLDRLWSRSEGTADTVKDLRQERDQLIELLRRCRAAARDPEALSPAGGEARENLLGLSRDVATASIWHLQRVQQTILPMALLTLNASDWADVYAQFCSTDDELGGQTDENT